MPQGTERSEAPPPHDMADPARAAPRCPHVIWADGIELVGGRKRCTSDAEVARSYRQIIG
jgi:hypothetical protein